MLDDQSPGILFLTETPLHIRSGALTHVLRNRGYRIHYHSANAPSPPDAIPEARIPDHLTHAGGGYHMRSGANSSHGRKSSLHIMLHPTTTIGAPTSLQSTCEPTPSAPTPDSHNRRRPIGRLGGHRPKKPQHHISSFCEMERADNPHFPTTPTAKLGLLHRSSLSVGS
jgi:hypothetical protein